jgi:hypothetical protein
MSAQTILPTQTPINQFIAQIHGSHIPYISLPSIPTSISLAQDPTNRFTFTYYGVSPIGNSPYRHFSLWDSWMEREYSVYVLLRRRKASIAISKIGARGSFDFSSADVSRNDEVRNAIIASLMQLQTKSLPSMDIVI